MVMPVRVKICGITNEADALAAVEAGADALGFMFFDGSVRHISRTAAAKIIRHLPPFVVRVGVFVDPAEEFVRQAIVDCRLTAIQLHGNETPIFCRRFKMSVIKAFRIDGERALHLLPQYATSAWLLDSFVPGKLGGTGAKFNWDLAIRAKEFGRPILLAGGLTPENVASAVKRVHPYAVDVSSGVESAPGKKDHAKLRAFIAAAKQADEHRTAEK
jgi:phosphoribosylanthranilate isomerase